MPSLTKGSWAAGKIYIYLGLFNDTIILQFTPIYARKWLWPVRRSAGRYLNPALLE